MSGDIENAQPQDVADAVEGYTATTVPVHVEVAVDQVVLHFGEAEALLRTAHSIALGPCECRLKHHRCDAPVDVCLTLNDASEAAVETREWFRTVSVEEALRALCLSHEAGLVHLAYRMAGLAATLF